jgi:hypothetical protein
MDRRDILDKKYYIARGKYPDESLSDIEVCMSILAADKEAYLDWCELYRGWVLGISSHNPIDLVAKRINNDN